MVPVAATELITATLPLFGGLVQSWLGLRCPVFRIGFLRFPFAAARMVAGAAGIVLAYLLARGVRPELRRLAGGHSLDGGGVGRDTC